MGFNLPSRLLASPRKTMYSRYPAYRAFQSAKQITGFPKIPGVGT